VSGEGTTRDVVRYARAITFDTLPADVILVAKSCLLDWLGCALGGSREPLTEILVAESATHGPASLIGHEKRTSVQWAALVNGAASHALDYDDTHLHMSGHPSVPVAPAILALGEERKASGKQLLAAFVSGVETECRLGALMGAGHYGAGWHATATLGTFGSAAACSHLLGLPEPGWLHAFGIAGTQASGLKSVFGTMSKPFQAGKAAAEGLLAAKLAASGFTSSTEILETHQGFAATHTTTFSPKALASLEGRWLVKETLFKYHASCYLTHSAMEAAVGLRERDKIDAAEIQDVRVTVPPGHLDVCGISEPRTGLEGKFSLRATVAMTLLGDDTADPSAFTDDRVTSKEVVGLRDRITVEPSVDVKGTASRVEIVTRDGASFAREDDVGTPADDLDRQWERLTTKFIRLASPVLGEERSWALHDLVWRLDELDDVTALTSSSGPG
jgi:2-methylcitrate dehydratase PrpD